MNFSIVMGSGRNKICGAIGIIDFSKYLSSGGVVERFKDIRFFKNFKIHEELGVLRWGNEVALCSTVSLPEPDHEHSTFLLIDIHPEHLPLWV